MDKHAKKLKQNAKEAVYAKCRRNREKKTGIMTYK